MLYFLERRPKFTPNRPATIVAVAAAGRVVESGALSTYIFFVAGIILHSSFVTRPGLKAQQILFSVDNLRNDRQVVRFCVCLCVRLATSVCRWQLFL